MDRLIAKTSAKRACLSLGAVVALLVGGSRVAQAHKPVTSPYDYNNAIFPLLRAQCAQCHADGGAAPMSLMTYQDAVSWAESIRDELQGGRMPPWPVDPRSRPVKGGRLISPHDLDAIVTWAAGGTPHAWTGDPNAALPKVVVKNVWRLGTPDLAIAMPAAHTVGKDSLDETADVTLPVPITGAKWVKAVDLLPGAPAIVRDAIISIDNGETLAFWQAGTDVVPAPTGTAFRLQPDSKIHLQIHYKKHYDQQQTSIADTSTVGLYFGPASSQRIESLKVAPGAADSPAAAQTFSAVLPKAVRIVALSPLLDTAYDAVDVTAVSPDGQRIPLLKLRGPRPQWFYRYWLQDAVDVPAATKIEVTTSSLPTFADDLKAPERFKLQVGIDFTTAGAHGSAQ